MAAAGKKSRGIPMLNRTVKFELHLSPEQERKFIEISQALIGPWNWVYDTYKAIGEIRRIKEQENTLLTMRSAVGKAVAVLFGKVAQELPSYPITISFNSALPGMTERHVDWQGVPTDWQRQTIDMAVASWVSFFQLRKNGDPHARPPGRAVVNRFLPVTGCGGFTYRDGHIAFAPRVLGSGFTFAVPEYAQRKIEEALNLEKGGECGKVTKFVIRRSNPNLAEAGTYWCSISYKYPAPDMVPVEVDTRIYLALGASSIGVLTASHESVITLWRPDKHWKAQIAEVEARLKNPALKKGSKRSGKLWDARRRMFEIMRLQQRQNHREVVRKLLAFGKHFVVPDYVVRSKPGKLADRKEAERGGPHGLNWAAQNTGGFLDLLMVLEERVKEVGGSVTKVKLPPPPRGIGRGSDNKLAMAVHVRNTFVTT